VLSKLRHAAFPLFAWALVLHSLAMAVLFGALGVDIQIARSVAAWKEIVLALLLAAVIVRAHVRTTPGSVIATPDLLVGALVATALAYLVAGNTIFRAGLPEASQWLGFRDAAYFLLAYFVGRSAPGLVGNDIVIKRLFILVVIICLIGILERIFLTPEMLVALGVAAYFQEFLGVAQFTVGNEYGLPLNYWAGIGGVAVRRAGSVFLSGQGFAVPMLLLFPTALVWAFHRDRTSAWKALGVVVVGVGLLLTLTRMTIGVVFVQIVLFAAVKRRPEWALPGFGVGAVLLLLLLATFPGFGEFVWTSLTFQESSSASHVRDWSRGLTAFFERPWGWGLGTADQTAVRAGLVPITGDNLYLKYSAELGILGIGLLVATGAAIGASAYRLFLRGVTPDRQRLGLIVLLATIGIGMNGVTGSVFNSVPLAWLYFWMAGAAVTWEQRVTAASLPAHPYGSPLPVMP
jgi:hypothetical protein